MADTITFEATIAQVKTMADYGLRVVLDLPEDAVEQVAMLIALKREGKVLRIVVNAQK